jgi:hypothetical protein
MCSSLTLERVERLKMGLEGVDWIHLAKDKNRWRAFVNTGMNLRLEQILGISGLAQLTNNF